MAADLRDRQVRGFQQTITELVRAEVRRWPWGRRFPLLPRMHALSLAVVLRAVHGLPDTGRLADLTRRVERLYAAGRSLLVLAPGVQRDLPGSPWRRLIRGRRAVVEVLLAELRKLADGGAANSVITHLLAAVDTGELGADELADQVVTLMLAGYATTGTAMAWMVDSVLRRSPTRARRHARGPAHPRPGRTGRAGRARLTGIRSRTPRSARCPAPP